MLSRVRAQYQGSRADGVAAWRFVAKAGELLAVLCSGFFTSAAGLVNNDTTDGSLNRPDECVYSDAVQSIRRYICGLETTGEACIKRELL